MQSLSGWVLGLVASPIGVVVLAFLDSTPLFALPGGIDAAVLVLAARNHANAWAVALLAIAGSLAGATLTFWLGAKAGEQGLERYISAKRLKRIRSKVRSVGAIELAVLDLIPPPFPFTPFVLAAGALEVDAATFFRTLVACRVLRFGVEAWLAVVYGDQILVWFDSDAFRNIVVGCALIAGALTAVSMVQLIKSSRATPGVAASR